MAGALRAQVKEHDFQRWVMDVARRLGWKVWHVPAPMRWDSTGRGKGFVGAKDAAGLADLIIVGHGRVLFAEVKGTGGKLSAKQQEFLDTVNALEADSVRAYAWWPGMENEVEEILRARPHGIDINDPNHPRDEKTGQFITPDASPA